MPEPTPLSDKSASVTRPGYDEALEVLRDALSRKKSMRYALEAAYPIIEAAVQTDLLARDHAMASAARADERRRIVEALRAREPAQWTDFSFDWGTIAADFIERECQS